MVIYSEYLELSRLPQNGHRERLIHYLNSKYQSQPLGAVICIGYPALKLLSEYRNKFLPNVPLVFTAVQRERLNGLALGAATTGTAHADQWTTAMEGLLQIDPLTKLVVVAGGAADEDHLLMEQKRKAFAPLATRVQFRYLENLPLLDIIETVRHLPPHSLVLTSGFTFDSTGRSLADDGALQLIYNASRAPVYSLIGDNLGQGFVGGPVAAYRERFAQAAEIVVRLISGEKASSIPVQDVVPERSFAFHWRELQRWQIPVNRLPPGSLVQFREPSLWEKYRWQIVLALSLFAFQSLLIVALLIQRSRLRKADEELREREQYLQASHEEIRVLAGQLITAQEDERRLIARKLHDDLSQQTVAMGLLISRLTVGRDAATDRSQDRMRRLQAGMEKLSESIHRLSHQLHPALLEQCGLITALEAHCNEFTELTGIPVTQHYTADDSAIPREIGLCLFRIVQEALRNVARHSNAREAAVQLLCTGNQMELIISDTGSGFDLQKAKSGGGLGLTSLQERARLANASLHIETAAGRGTSLTVRFTGCHPPAPLPEATIQKST